MTTHDAINAVFEGGGAIALCLNVRRLLKDKSVKGVSLLTTSWWTAWVFWSVYFYAAVSCDASFWAGLAVVIVNAVWLGLATYYARPHRLGRPRSVPAPRYFTLYDFELCACAPRRPLAQGGAVFLCTACRGFHGGAL